MADRKISQLPHLEEIDGKEQLVVEKADYNYNVSIEEIRKLPAGSIGTNELSDGCVTGTKITNGAVAKEKIAAGAVVEEKIGDSQVTLRKLADNSVAERCIKEGAVTERKLKDGSVTEGKVADNAISTSKIQKGAVTREKLSADALEIPDRSVTAEKLAVDAVQTVNIASKAVDGGAIADEAVTTKKIADEAVTTKKIADEAVTRQKIADETITYNEIADGAIITRKIYDKSVTKAKLADEVFNEFASKDFVNSSIATNTAEFKGTFTSLEQLQATTADANDYGFVVTTDVEGNTVYNRYKYTDGEGWKFEYALNNSSFTAAQWAAIQSGITSGNVEKLNALPNASDILTSKQAAVKYQPIGDYATKNELDVVETLAESINKGLGETQLEVEKAKFALFIDLWNEACGAYGTYNEETGYFELNGLTDITYEQAIDIYNIGSIEVADSQCRYKGANIRTNLPAKSSFPMQTSSGPILNLTGGFDASKVEVVNMKNLLYPSFATKITFDSIANIGIFRACSNLKRILGALALNKADMYFVLGCTLLEDIELYGVSFNLDFRQCPLISCKSFAYLVKNASNKNAITITVVSNIYSALIGEVDYPFNGGTQEEWEQLLQDATEKQITFATA